MREPLVTRLQGMGTTIFAEMSELAVTTKSVNLGQGFPDTDGPQVVLDAAVEAIRSGHNQYPPGPGIPALREAIAEHQKRFYSLSYDPDTEVLVTAGATEAIASALIALVEPGDEVITLEPYYDSYAACIAMAGGMRRTVVLRPPDFRLDLDALRDAVSDRTRLILLNSPHNPTGMVLQREELEAVAEIARERDLLVVTDEVYEHMVFESEHIPIATLPGMRERTVTISSAGKTFSVTGWKIGWACSTPALVSAVRTAKQFLTYVNGGPFQHAVATGLRLGDDYFESLGTQLRVKRDVLCEGLAEAGFKVYRPTGTYFVTTGIGGLSADDGPAFCRELPTRCGVVAIPNAVFHDDPEAGRRLVRFNFAKRHDVLQEAIGRLRTLRTAAAR